MMLLREHKAKVSTEDSTYLKSCTSNGSNCKCRAHGKLQIHNLCKAKLRVHYIATEASQVTQFENNLMKKYKNNRGKTM